MASNGFTPTERRILDVLADEQRHTFEELWGCLNDELAGRNTLSVHLSGLREKLKTKGRNIISIRDSGVGYFQLTRRLMPSTEG
jgi:DNA-binding response OmpR family regulator